MIKNLIEIKFCLCCSDCKTKWRQPLCSWFPSTPDHEPIPRCPTGLSRAKKKILPHCFHVCLYYHLTKFYTRTREMTLIKWNQSYYVNSRRNIHSEKSESQIKVCRVSWHFVPRPPYAGGIWKPRFHSENASNVFRPHYAEEKFENKTITGHAGFAWEKNRSGKSHRYRNAFVFEKGKGFSVPPKNLQSSPGLQQKHDPL